MAAGTMRLDSRCKLLIALELPVQTVAKEALESEDNVPSNIALQDLLPATAKLLQQCQHWTLPAEPNLAKL